VLSEKKIKLKLGNCFYIHASKGGNRKVIVGNIKFKLILRRKKGTKNKREKIKHVKKE